MRALDWSTTDLGPGLAIAPLAARGVRSVLAAGHAMLISCALASVSRWTIVMTALEVHDDGAGFEAAVIETSEDAPFGRRGMQERAARISGQLTVVCGDNRVTTTTLTVAGQMAFRLA
jgi:signal transduction histidine kinase